MHLSSACAFVLVKTFKTKWSRSFLKLLLQRQLCQRLSCGLRPAPSGWLWTLASTVLFPETQMAMCPVPVGIRVTSADMLVCLLSRRSLGIRRPVGGLSSSTLPDRDPVLPAELTCKARDLPSCCGIYSSHGDRHRCWGLAPCCRRADQTAMSPPLFQAHL